tara:strand:+ start:193 stop:345 length:153 start_codon:yes stop_codon:yes gene_type:complete
MKNDFEVEKMKDYKTVNLEEIEKLEATNTEEMGKFGTINTEDKMEDFKDK